MNYRRDTGIALLRYGLSFVFLWFGFSQLSNAAVWVSFVPEWLTAFADPGLFVYGNALLEIVLGSLLALGILVRPVSLILALHLFVITLEIGLTAVGVRDFGLALATLSLFFMGKDRFTLGKRTEQQPL